MPHATTRIALAGEYLAASYLLRFCDSVILAPQAHRSDLILDHQNKLYRVQVKTTNSTYLRRGKDYYRWELRSGRRTAKKERQDSDERYGNGQIDLFSLVALPLDKVIFMPFNKEKNLTEFAKTEERLLEIDTKESLQACLDQANESPKLTPLDL